MKANRFLHIVLLLLALFSFSNVFAQDEEDESDYVYEDEYDWEDYDYIDTTRDKIDSVLEFKKERINGYLTQDTVVIDSLIEVREFDNSLWQKFHEERDYQEKIEKEKEKNNSTWDWPNFGFAGLGFMAVLFKFLIYAIIILGIGFVIFKLLEAQYKQDSLIKKENDFLIERLDEKIHEIDLYKLLEEYIQKSDYKTIIRIYYLIIIKELSNRKFILWEIQKTNGNYLQEMFNHALFKNLSKLTMIYERIWFGEIELDEISFKQVEPLFKDLIQKIKNSTIVGNK